MRFINYQYSGETLLNLSYSKSIHCSKQVSLGGLCDLNSQVSGCVTQKIDHGQIWSKNVGERDSFIPPRFEQTTHHQCLSGSDFAGHDNEPFALEYGITNRRQSLLAFFRGKQKGRIRRELERSAI